MGITVRHDDPRAQVRAIYETNLEDELAAEEQRRRRAAIAGPGGTSGRRFQPGGAMDRAALQTKIVYGGDGTLMTYRDKKTGWQKVDPNREAPGARKRKEQKERIGDLKAKLTEQQLQAQLNQGRGYLPPGGFQAGGGTVPTGGGPGFRGEISPPPPGSTPPEIVQRLEDKLKTKGALGLDDLRALKQARAAIPEFEEREAEFQRQEIYKQQQQARAEYNRAIDDPEEVPLREDEEWTDKAQKAKTRILKEIEQIRLSTKLRPHEKVAEIARKKEQYANIKPKKVSEAEQRRRREEQELSDSERKLQIAKNQRELERLQGLQTQPIPEYDPMTDTIVTVGPDGKKEKYDVGADRDRLNSELDRIKDAKFRESERLRKETKLETHDPDTGKRHITAKRVPVHKPEEITKIINEQYNEREKRVESRIKELNDKVRQYSAPDVPYEFPTQEEQEEFYAREEQPSLEEQEQYFAEQDAMDLNETAELQAQVDAGGMSLQDAARAKINSLVAQGKITPEQAERALLKIGQ